MSEVAIFAGGCFWCIEPPFQQLNGVIKVEPGYTGGKTINPTYDEVCSGETGHIESIRVTFDPSKISYSQLLDVFWRQIDPTDIGGQFVDRGSQYATAIFFHNEEQRRSAVASKKALDEGGTFKAPVVTAILPAQQFYLAEDYHHDFHNKSPVRYKSYRSASGRDNFLARVWKDKS